MRRVAVSLVIVVLLCVGLAVSPAIGAARFDGLTWYHSEDPSRLILNEKGHLVWLKPHAPDQVTVQLPEMDLSDVGDAAEVVYMFRTEGTKTGVPSTDPTLLSGTGDIRIGLFDSNKRGHTDRDNAGYRNDLWCGYLGYCARICPHLPAGIKREHSDAIPGNVMKHTNAFEEGVYESLVQKAGPYGMSRDLSGFGLEMGVFSALILQVERKAADTLVFRVTLNDVRYEYVDDDPPLNPRRLMRWRCTFPIPRRMLR
jgi:hypothetical protein